MKIFKEEEVFAHPQENIHISRKESLTEKEPIHTHEFVEMTYYLDGGAIHTINGRDFEVQKGDFLLLNANQAHSHVPTPYVSYIHIFVRNDFMRSSVLTADNTLELFFLSSLFDELGDSSPFSPVINFRGTEMLEIEALCESMLAEYDKRPLSYDTVLESYVKILLVKILRQIHLSADKKWIREMRVVTPDLLDFLNKNFSDTLTAQDFAKQSFYSPAYFSRLFKSCCGKSIKEYITEKRMQEAVTLLCTTDYSVDRIAADVGYSNKNQFYKSFKAYTGQTPAQFRKSRK